MYFKQIYCMILLNNKALKSKTINLQVAKLPFFFFWSLNF